MSARPKRQDREEMRASREAALPRVRCTRAERVQVESKASASGLHLAEYMRRALLRSKVVVRQDKSDPEVVRHLLAIGNNLNQLTRIAHMTNRVDVERLESVLARVEHAVMELID